MGKIDFQSIYYYFDAVNQDRMDAGGISRKTAEILKLRDKLILLPPDDFDAAIKALDKLCEPKANHDGQRPAIPRKDQGLELYERSRSKDVGVAKTESVGRVS